MKNLLEVVKANKGRIVKRALIIGASIAGLVVVGKLVAPKKDEIEIIPAVEAEPAESNEEEEREETTNE
jgi:hypothetical protein